MCPSGKQRTGPRYASLRLTAILLPLGAAVAAVLSGCGAGNFFAAQVTAVAASKGPQLGYLWMAKDQTLRPILGVAGSSQLGQSVVPAAAFLSAATTAKGAYALMQASDGKVDLISLPDGAATSLPVTIAAGAVLSLSPSGASGVAYLPGTTSASVVTGLPASPAVRLVSSPGPIVDAAVSDAGSVAFESPSGSALSASVIGSDGKAHLVASLRAPGGMAFVPGKDSLLLADNAANTLTLVVSASSAPAISTVSTAALLQAPTAVGVSSSGHWAMVANSSGNGVVSVDLVHNSSVAVACTCAPTAAAPLADDGTFRITAVPTGPNWVVDGTQSAAPRVLFIPPLAALMPMLHLSTGAWL